MTNEQPQIPTRPRCKGTCGDTECEQMELGWRAWRIAALEAERDALQIGLDSQIDISNNLRDRLTSLESTVFSQIDGLLPVDPSAIEEFKREMTNRVIPEIISKKNKANFILYLRELKGKGWWLCGEKSDASCRVGLIYFREGEEYLQISSPSFYPTKKLARAAGEKAGYRVLDL